MGLYDWLFGPATPPSSVNPERHWKREQDNYLIQIGAMDLINRDPYASRGYKAREHPDYLTLNMGATPSSDAYGDYLWRKAFEEPPPGTVKRSGHLNVAVDQSPQDYGATIVHELGHVGARNSKSEEEASKTTRSGAEEIRQRLTDYLLNAPGTRQHKFAVSALRETGLSDKEIEDKADALVKTQGVRRAWKRK